MKRLIIAFFAIMPFMAYASNPLPEEIEIAIVDCKNDEIARNVNLMGTDFILTARINTRPDGKCAVEIINENTIAINTTRCVFSIGQRQELADALNDDGTTEHEINIPVYGQDENGQAIALSEAPLKGSLQEITWGKFLNDPATCSSQNTEKDPRPQLARALQNCKNFSNEAEFSGMRIAVTIKPEANELCRYRIYAETQGFSITAYGQEKTVSPLKIGADCLLTPEQRLQAAEYILSNPIKQDEMITGRQQNESASLMLPEAFTKDSNICQVTSGTSQKD